MAIETPTPDEISDKIFLNTVTALNQNQSSCSVSIIQAFSKAIGNQIWAAYVCRETLGFTPLDATGSVLDAFGANCGIERLNATYAVGFITVTGTATIPEGSLLTRCDGVRYEVLEQTDAPSTTIPVIALDIGTRGNSQSTVGLTFDSPIIGISNDAFVSANGIAGGSDVEKESDFRERVIACTANPCRTGTVQDYQFWASSYNGVTSTSVIGCHYGPGTVKLCFAMQENYLNGIPLQQDIENLQGIIDANQPLGVKTTVCAAEPVEINISIRLLGDKTLNTRQLIIDNLVQTFKIAPIGNFCLSDIYSSIGQVYNDCFELVSPTESFNLGNCQLPVIGQINFVS